VRSHLAESILEHINESIILASIHKETKNCRRALIHLLPQVILDEHNVDDLSDGGNIIQLLGHFDKSLPMANVLHNPLR
jgi:hypothetical protein